LIIAGFVKNSFVDYPGRIAAVVFTQGCNMDCWYCHNRELIPVARTDSSPAAEHIDVEEIFDFLCIRKGMIDAVVITGGEPTLQDGLADFIKRVKDMGYLVKLDTNGTRPEVLKELIKSVDFVAMDIKAPLSNVQCTMYNVQLKDNSNNVQCTMYNVQLKNNKSTGQLRDKIRESIDLIKNGGARYEFRTTFVPELTKDDILEICREIAPCESYVLQQYRSNTLSADGVQPPNRSGELTPHSAKHILDTAEEVKKIIPNVSMRGL